MLANSFWKRCARCLGLAALMVMVSASVFGIDAPASPDERLTVQLVAQEPEILTPTGLAVDALGRIWVIENNTHFRPKNYKGFATDRILIFEDFAPDGRAKKISTFAADFKNAMSLALGSGGDVYLATRSEIFLLRDTNNDGSADERKSLAKLETTGDYPHNGLAGLAIGPDDNLYFGLGENLGHPYKLVGADGAALSGGGEGGNVYRSRRDGSRLERIATGFWNPFGLGFDAFGRLFAVDNDPDGRPPCRLLHVVAGGDYGYRFRYGRKGQHPFTAWNGEIPGTLPMLSGTGEGACEVRACEFSGWPKEYRGDLLVTCWGDHLIQRFKPVAENGSFKATPEILIKGGNEFRPVAIAPAPDGSLVVSDWVSTSYPVHGKGRIWRIKVKDATDDGMRAAKVKELEPAKIQSLLVHESLLVRTAAAETLASSPSSGLLLETLQKDPDVRARAAALHGLAKNSEKRTAAAELALNDKAPEMRLAGLRYWPDDAAADEKLLALLRAEASAEVRAEALAHLRDRKSAAAVVPLLATDDPFLFSAAIDSLGRLGDIELLLKNTQAENARVRLGVLLSLRRFEELAARETLPKFLADTDPAVRRAAFQWIGEARIKDLGGALNECVKLPMTRDLFEAFVAARGLIGGDKDSKADTPEFPISQILTGATHPPALRALALRNLRVDHPDVNVARLKELAASDHAELRAEAIRALSMHSHKDAQPELRKLAEDAALSSELRADAIAGLALSATVPETRALLLGLLSGDAAPELQREALRSLRGAASENEVQQALRAFGANLPAANAEWRQELAEQTAATLKSAGATADSLAELVALAGTRPQNEAEWKARIAKSGASARAGARIFYHARGAQCFVCHRINGRGGNVGPDLSTIGAAMIRDKLLQSILEPSREIAPQFIAWTVTQKNGQSVTGVIHDENIHGALTVVDAQGKQVKINAGSVERRVAQKVSLMPESLIETMTQQELSDLIEFLATCGRHEGAAK